MALFRNTLASVRNCPLSEMMARETTETPLFPPRESDCHLCALYGPVLVANQFLLLTAYRQRTHLSNLTHYNAPSVLVPEIC